MQKIHFPNLDKQNSLAHIIHGEESGSDTTAKVTWMFLRRP